MAEALQHLSGNPGSVPPGALRVQPSIQARRQVARLVGSRSARWSYVGRDRGEQPGAEVGSSSR